MTIHKPKLISSKQGLGVNTTKTLEIISEKLAIGTEIWGKIDKPWAESDTIIAEEGYSWRTRWEANKPYVITKFFNNSGELVGIYCDITRPVRKVGDGFEFDDLYLDVWIIPGNKPVILDEDEFAEAIDAGFIDKDEANLAMKNTQLLVSKLSDSSCELLVF